jgi:GntR family transcriptional regulator
MRSRSRASLETEQPRYMSVYRLIADEIAAGNLRPGTRLPAERVLCRRLSVGRATVRRAMHELASDGLVESSVGRGTFVSAGTVSECPNELISLTDLGASRGLPTTSEVLERQVRPATMDEADAFSIAPGGDLFEIERLRLLDGLPFAIMRSRVPLSRAPGVRSVDFTSASLYETLRANGAGPVRADQVVWAAPADARQASLLGLAQGDPVLASTTAGYDAQRRLVEMSEMVFRADRYRFRATLTHKA